MADQLYALAFVNVNGTLLAQELDVSVRRSTNSQPVNTVPGGYSGESPGAAMVEIDVTNAVPATTGFEFNAGQNMLTLTPTKVFVILGNNVYQLKCTVQIVSDTFRHSVNNPSSYAFSARGAFVDWG